MRMRIGWIAVVVLFCAAGSLLSAARSTPAASEAKTSCAGLPTTTVEMSVDRSTPIEPAASDNRKGGCGQGVQRCTASQVGQPCNPNNLNVLCSAQANGAYCCLAYAP